MPSYLTDDLGIGDVAEQLITIGVEFGMLLVIAPLGRLSDRVGRKPLLATAAAGYVLLSFPAITLMQLHSPVAVTAGCAIMGGLLVLMLAVIGSTFPAMFPTQVRYGAFAIGYNVSTSVFGGTSALVIGSLIDVYHTNYIPAFYLVVAGLVALGPILLIPETAGVSIRNIVTPGRSRQPAAATG